MEKAINLSVVVQCDRSVNTLLPALEEALGGPSADGLIVQFRGVRVQTATLRVFITAEDESPAEDFASDARNALTARFARWQATKGVGDTLHLGPISEIDAP